MDRIPYLSSSHLGAPTTNAAEILVLPQLVPHGTYLVVVRKPCGKH